VNARVNTKMGITCPLQINKRRVHIAVDHPVVSGIQTDKEGVTTSLTNFLQAVLVQHDTLTNKLGDKVGQRKG
jgi:hypothetical protein